MYVNSNTQLFPLLKLAIALIIGIVIGGELTDVASFSVWLSMLVVSLLGTLFAGKHLSLHTAGIYLFFICFGALLISHQMTTQKIEWRKSPVHLEGVIVNSPVVKKSVVECDVRIMYAMTDEKSPQSCMKMESPPLIKAFIKKDKGSGMLDVGDGISFLSVVRKPSNRGNIGFDYAHYLLMHGFSGTTFVRDGYWCADVVDISSLSLVEKTKLKMMRLRSSFLHRYSSLGLTGQSYAVTAALTMGDKSCLDMSTKNVYSHAGASHILALSGLHLGILYSILTFLLGAKNRYLSTSFILLAVWAFVLMVGLSPSVVRAAVMLSIHAFVSMLNRDKTSINTLALAAMIMLICSPQCLYDVGFQLSFLAVLSILMFYSPMYESLNLKWMACHRFILYGIQMILVSVAAQIGTFPLVMFYFGNFPVYFLLTNIIVIPLATIALYVSVLLFSLFFIPAVQYFVAAILMTVVSSMNLMVSMINRLPFSTITNLSPSVVQVILIYLSILSVYSLMLKHSSRRLKLSLTVILVTLVSYFPFF
jgi:competence protein ComEC